MRHPILLTLCAAGVFGLSACDKSIDADAVDREFAGVNAIDGTGLNDVMLTAGDPDDAVAYFRRADTLDPDRIDLKRGLAKSLVRAKRSTEAVAAWSRVVAHEGAGPEDSVSLADALIRNNARSPGGFEKNVWSRFARGNFLGRDPSMQELAPGKVFHNGVYDR